MGVVSWLFSHKLVCLFILATIAFGVATIVLAVDNASLSEDLDNCKMVDIPNDTTTESATTTEVSTTEASTTAEPTEEPPPDLTNYRLPTNVVPTAYEIDIVPDLLTGELRGFVNISCDVLEPTATIKVHSNGLTITHLYILGVPSTFTIDTTHELIVIRTESTLQIGRTYHIAIYFSGDMKNRIVGLYTSRYTENEETRTIATSKFEPTYARQAYPCFDEPNMKAKFTVNILKPHDESYIALSNMPVVGETPEPNGTLVHFAESVPMSTYLTCFIVSDFGYKEKNLTDGKPFRVYATPGQVDKTEHALDVGTHVLEFFTEYFGIPFPLPKIDMAAIPDFVSGAMEHWGLVTFRETNLLYDPSISSTANKQSIATVVAHELAHSWFGNLVTMDWWNDLWLNEGFASYIEYKGVDNYDPSWQMLDQFLISDLHPVLILDATLGSHPIVQTVTTPDEITEIFDTISYNKGASVLRMLENAVGETVFKNGVTAYLNAHMYGNAVTQDLWDELQTISGDSLDVTEFMNTWTLQTGYPIVNVASVGNNFVLTQKRYLTDEENEGTDPGVAPYNNRWTIPITYTTNTNAEPELVWFNYNVNELRIPKPTGTTWIKFNHNQIGYYRVNYERDHWNTLAQNIISMSTSDKTHLLEESFHIAESGQLSYEVPLSLSRFLTEEHRSYVPWSVALTMFGKLRDYLSSSEYSGHFRQFVIELLTNAYQTLTWTENAADTHIEKRARVTILDLACSIGYEECLSSAQENFNRWITEEIELSQDLRPLVYNYGMATASSSAWDLVWNKFIAETDAAEKLKLLRGLTSTNNPSLLNRLIERAKEETYIRRQDYFTLLQYIASNSIGRPIVWDYVRENWLALVDRFGLNDRYLGSLIPSITNGFMTNIKLDEMNAFFTKHSQAGAGAAARIRALETVGNNIKWQARNKEAVESWLQSNVRSTKS